MGYEDGVGGAAVYGDDDIDQWNADIDGGRRLGGRAPSVMELEAIGWAVARACWFGDSPMEAAWRECDDLGVDFADDAVMDVAYRVSMATRDVTVWEDWERQAKRAIGGGCDAG